MIHSQILAHRNILQVPEDNFSKLSICSWRLNGFSCPSACPSEVGKCGTHSKPLPGCNCRQKPPFRHGEERQSSRSMVHLSPAVPVEDEYHIMLMGYFVKIFPTFSYFYKFGEDVLLKLFGGQRMKNN